MGGVRLGVWGVVLIVCLCVGVGGVVLCRCVRVCDLLIFLLYLGDGFPVPLITAGLLAQWFGP